MSHIRGRCKMKWIPMPFGRCQRIGWRGAGLVTDTSMWMLPGTEITCLTRSGRQTCFRNQHIAGGKTGVLIYVRMNRESLRGWGSVESNLHSGPGPSCRTDSDHIIKQCLLHILAAYRMVIPEKYMNHLMEFIFSRDYKRTRTRLITSLLVAELGLTFWPLDSQPTCYYNTTRKIT